MILDPITETIAHFIGHFNLQAEQARMREAYDRIKATAEKKDNEYKLQPVDAKGDQEHEFSDFDPGVRFVNEGDPVVLPPVTKLPSLMPPLQPDLASLGPADPAHLKQLATAFAGASPGQGFIVEPPSSLAALIKQDIWLSDHDYVTNADVHIDPIDPAEAWRQLSVLAGKAGELEVLDTSADLSSEDGVASFISQSREALDAFTTAADTDATVTVVHDGALLGTWVNGSETTDVPGFVDSLPASLQPEDDETGASTPINADETGGFVDLTAGSNLIVNQANLANSWVVSPVIAVAGDSIKLDIISQVNVIHDIDSVDVAAGWTSGPGQANALFSIASFAMTSNPVNAATDEDGAAAGFPSDWAVTTIDGNLLFLNWIEQYTLMSDADTSVLSSSGSATMIMAGGNLATNSVSLLDLGHYYDLIIIDGSMYNANIISQMNVLLDDDTIWTLAGGPQSATGELGTSGNLLWKNASINTIGTAQYEALAGAYADTADSFANGKDKVSDGVLEDPAFAGLDALRVLHVTGDMISLQYIKQTTILGDQDQVALAGDALLANPQAEWTMTTGENALANFATITDAGVDGTVHVGGEQYSDALLYQAEFISTEPLAAGANDPLVLATEAVVFLADDVTAQDNGDNADMGYVRAGETPADIMQTVLG